VAKHVVATAFDSWQANKDFAIAVGLSPQNTPETNWANVRAVWSDGPEGDAARARLKRVVPYITPSSSPLMLNFGYTYHEGALVHDGPAELDLPDPMGTFTPSTRPGCSLPDRWVADLSSMTALGDLVGRGRFVLIAGEEGQDWVGAAKRVARARAIPLDAFTVGSGEADWLDARGAWTRVRGYGPSGAILVRPDRFVAWRAKAGSPRPDADLHAAFDAILGVAA
jgi:2,4-dichlorophenol 6-monooxygenase